MSDPEPPDERQNPVTTEPSNVIDLDGNAQPATITPGPFTLAAQCPECSQTVRFPIELFPRFTADQHGSKLRVVLSSKALEHECGTENTEPMF
jgi:hypothetical protein